jgi:hypothetical protein
MHQSVLLSFFAYGVLASALHTLLLTKQVLVVYCIVNKLSTPKNSSNEGPSEICTLVGYYAASCGNCNITVVGFLSGSDS